MAAGSLTLGGNLSLAVGPLGRNGEAIGSLNTSGKVAAMYSYSKTRGLFGGVSIEGSVIVERQDANAQAYRTDVTAKQLLSGAIPPPEWASSLVKTLESCTGMPGGRRWVQEFQDHHPNDPYMFGGVESPGLENHPFDLQDSPSGGARTPRTETPPIGNGTNGKLSKKKKEKSSSISFPPLQWGRQKSSGSYFSGFHDPSRAPEPIDAHTPSPKLPPEDRPSPRLDRVLNPSTGFFETRFQSDYMSDDQLRQHPPLHRRTSAGRPSLTADMDRDWNRDGDREGGRKKTKDDELEWEPDSPFNDLPSGAFSEARSNMSDATSHRRAFSAYAPSASSASVSRPARKSSNPFEAWAAREEETFDDDLLGGGRSAGTRDFEAHGKPRLAPKKELTRPLLPHEGVARAIALYDFKAVQVRVFFLLAFAFALAFMGLGGRCVWCINN